MGSRDGVIAPNGERVGGYLVGSGAGKVIVIHEIFGLNDHIRSLADRFAADGFTAFAIDLFDGRTSDALEGGFALAQALDWDRASGLVRDALRALGGGRASSVALVGFCMGGSVALTAAASASASIPSLAGCVDFYGIPAPDKGDLSRIRTRVLGHFADGDPYIANDRVDVLEQLLAGAGIETTFHRYRHDGHGFVREDPDGAATALSWQRTVAFLRDVLPSGA
jgi:carboxymethylenebutenolidase